MTDTGRFPGEGQPENAGATPGQPLTADAAAPADTGIPTVPTVPPAPSGRPTTGPSTYAFLADSDAADEDDLLLMPGAQGAWSEQSPVQGGTHETGGRDTGAAVFEEVRTPPAAPAAPRRPLHMGPPDPSSNGVVRSLADRGPAAPQQPVGSPVPHPPASPVTGTGPEYLDTPQTDAEHAAPADAEQVAQPGIWDAQPQQTPVADAAVPVVPAEQPAAPVESVEPTAGSPAPEAEPVVAFVPPQNTGPDVPAVPAVPAQGTPVTEPAAAGAPADGTSAEPVAAAPAAQEAVAPKEPAPVPAPGVTVPAQAAPVEPAAPVDPAVPGEPVASVEAVRQEAVAAPQETVPPARTPEPEETRQQADAPAPAPTVVEPLAEAVAEVTAPALDSAAPADAVPVPAPVAPAPAEEAAAPSEPAAVAPAPAPSSAPVSAVAEAPAAGDAAPAAAETPAVDGTPVAVEAPAPVVAEAAAPAEAPAPAPVAPSETPVPAEAVAPADAAVTAVPEAAQPAAAPAPVEAAPVVSEAPVPAPAEAAVPVAAEAAAPVEDAVSAEAPATAGTAVPAEPVASAEAAAPAETITQAQAPVTAEAPVTDVTPASAETAVASPETPAPTDAPVPAEAPAAPATPGDAPAPTEAPVAVAEPVVVADPAPAPAPPAPAQNEAPVDGPTTGQPATAEQPVAPAPVAALEEQAPAGTAETAQAPEPVAPAQAPEPARHETPEQPEATAPAAPEEPRPEPAAATVEQPTTEQPAAEQQSPEPTQVPEVPEAEAASVHLALVLDDEPQAVTDAEEEPAAPPVPVGPPADGYAAAEREAVHRVMRERRDIRNGFRPDPIPHDVLLRVLEAAHTAPSVGHSQPWDFVVIRSAETRRTMHELATRQRVAYADSLPKARAKQFKEMKIEAILETPVNIVVTADPTRGGRHTLGRHTQPQMAPYSSALAVENLWLAARAEGLGVGWVSFFDEREMVRELGLPEHLEVVAYLCVGYVDEFPDEPELMQAGWSKRRPLSWVVHEETYGRRALPGEDPHDLLAETLRGIRPLDAKALGEAWERQKRMTKPSGALGMLEIISAQLCGLSRKCPPPIPEPAAVAVFAGDHGVHAQGVTAWPQEVTSQMVANFLGGGAVCNAFANQVGAEVCVVDVGVAGELPPRPGLLPRKVRPGTDDFTTGPAMTREEALRAVEVGIETARDLVTAGNKALLTGEMGIANTTVSAALVSVFTGSDPAEVTGRGTGINDEMHARKVDVVRRALELHRPDPEDPIGVLAAVGGLEHAALVGLILGGASLRTPVILDGVSAGAAALVARAIAPEALAACIAGHRSAEPGHVAALTKLGLRPLVDLDLRLGEGTGALLALPVVQSAARAMHEVATFDSAGVAEKG